MGKEQLSQEELEQLALEKQMELERIASENTLIRVVAGSHAYGTNIETSDWDERGIFADSMYRVALPFEKIEQVKFIKDDIVIFELSKYMDLLLNQNPNVIELIWTAPEDILEISEFGQVLIDNRKEFLSSRVKDSYVGYAVGQLKRMKGHHKWLNNPQPEREPEQQDFTTVVYNLSDVKEYNKKVPTKGFTAFSLGDNHFSLWENSKLGIDLDKSWVDKRGNPNPITKQKLDELNVNNHRADIIIKINFQSFDQHHENWKMYWNWKKNRNEKRSVLEEQHGYDTKHAMHLIRLLRSGVDILEHGVVPVKREDFAYLLDIRNGVFTYDEIIKESEKLSAQVELLSKKTKLPEEPNREFAKQFMLDTYSHHWKLETKNKPKIK